MKNYGRDQFTKYGTPILKGANNVTYTNVTTTTKISLSKEILEKELEKIHSIITMRPTYYYKKTISNGDITGEYNLSEMENSVKTIAEYLKYLREQDNWNKLTLNKENIINLTDSTLHFKILERGELCVSIIVCYIISHYIL